MGNHERSTHPAGVWLALAVVMLIVAGLAGIAVLTYPRVAGQSSSAASPGELLAPLRIPAAAYGIHCPTDPAFSPSGAQVVVLGVLGACDGITGMPLDGAPHVAAIFDAQSGSLVMVQPLEPLLGVASRGARPATVLFFGLGWSPDADHIALVYIAFDSADVLTQDHLLDSGLLVLSAHGTPPTIIRGDSGYFPDIGGGPSGYPIWDLADQSEVSASTIAPGLAYTWGETGTPAPLVPLRGPLTQLPVNAGSRYPVGNPAGDPDFTIWQPGIVLGPAQASSLGGGRDVFLTVFPTWSPDGAHLTMLSAGVALAPPAGASTAAGSAAGSGVLPLPTPSVVAQAPGRDAALEAIERQLGGNGAALVAWSPSGAMLASVACQPTGGSTSLTLRSTLSGAMLSAVALDPSAGACDADSASGDNGAYPDRPVALLWSPTDQSVLVCDRATGTIILWPVTGASTQGA